MSLLSLAYLLLDRPMQRRFEADPAFQATALAAAGARAQGHRRFTRTPASSPTCAAPSGDGGAAGARLQQSRHGRTGSPSAFQRPLPRDGHQRGRRLQPLEGPGGHALARRHRRATAGARSAICAMWRAARSGRPRISRRSSAPTATRRSSPRRARNSAARDDDIETHTEIASRPKTTSSCAASRITNRSRAARDDRGDQLRGGRARAAGRGRSASGVQQSVRADRDRPSAPGDPLHAPAPLRGRARAVDVAPDGRARREDRGHLLRDRSHAFHRPRQYRCRSAGDERIRSALGQPRVRCSIRSSRSAIGSRSSRSRSATIDIVTGIAETARGGLEPGREIPGSAPGRSRLRPGVDARPGRPAAAQCHRGRCAALRPPGRARSSTPIPHCAPTQPSCMQNRRGQSGLWGYGISGDLPIVLLRIGGSGQHRSGAPTRAGACLLALEGTGRRPGHLERRSHPVTASRSTTRSWA